MRAAAYLAIAQRYQSTGVATIKIYLRVSAPSGAARRRKLSNRSIEIGTKLPDGVANVAGFANLFQRYTVVIEEERQIRTRSFPLQDARKLKSIRHFWDVRNGRHRHNQEISNTVRF